MPITWTIDHDRGLVVASASGVLTDAEVFRYQWEAWSKPELATYHELIDMTGVERIELPSGERVGDLAKYSAAMDGPARSGRVAIVAPGDEAYGLGRMYQANRAMQPGSRVEVAVFRGRAEAEWWLVSGKGA